MKMEQVRIRVKGRAVSVPAVSIEDRTVIVKGRWLKIASVHDEQWLAGDPVRDPQRFITLLEESKLRADLFTFAQRLSETAPKYNYPFEWDNAAAVPIVSFDHWLGKQAATDVRQNVKKSAKRGVVTRTVPFDDRFVQGIVDIYNESPIRQGRRFWHYGKNFETVKEETAHCLEQSEFIGAYCQDELIGFIKLLCAGPAADIVLIVCKQKYHDKRPTNALIAKAVEVCAQKGIRFLTYAKFSYDRKFKSSLVDFKRHHGFEPILFPRYYVPLTANGRIAVRLGLHHGIKAMVPDWMLSPLRSMRAAWVRRRPTVPSPAAPVAIK